MNHAARALLTAVVAVAAGCGGSGEPDCVISGDGPGIDPDGVFCERLSSYRFFEDIAAQRPAEGVIPYEVATPLFSDFAQKNRFLWLPPGAAMTWSDADAFALPVGAAVIKTFSYPRDRRDPAQGRRLLETRVLVRGADAWRGMSYVYAEGDDADATSAIAGAQLDAAWIHDDGAERTNRYTVPNQNQCKSCHAEHDRVLNVLGPKARHLNRPGPAGSGGDQLQALIDRGALTSAPPRASWPRGVIAADPASGTVEERARAWLDINCGACHNPRGGMARTSGLYLDISQTDPAQLGVCKPPVATGRGSGDRRFAIVPGQPDASILVYRLESTEADVKMPELGRNLVDDQGVALIRQWIAEMPGSCP